MDADDTLWENNLYFERAIAAFITLLGHKEQSAKESGAKEQIAREIRDVLNACERETIRRHGYGVLSFERSLLTCFEQVTGNHATALQAAQVRGFAQSIVDQEIELLPGVFDTLPGLAARHTVILTTKGNAEEQQHKLERSGMRKHFQAVEVPAEKHREAYLEIVSRYRLNPATTWMIGNSPRSDINPALAAGLHAVYIHHPHTWVLEQDVLLPPRPPQQLLQVENFAELALHF